MKQILLAPKLKFDGHRGFEFLAHPLPSPINRLRSTIASNHPPPHRRVGGRFSESQNRVTIMYFLRLVAPWGEGGTCQYCIMTLEAVGRSSGRSSGLKGSGWRGAGRGLRGEMGRPGPPVPSWAAGGNEIELASRKRKGPFPKSTKRRPTSWGGSCRV